MRCVQDAAVHWPLVSRLRRTRAGLLPSPPRRRPRPTPQFCCVLPFSFAYAVVVVVCVTKCFFTIPVLVIVPRSRQEQRVWQQPGRDTRQREGDVDRDLPGRVGARQVGRRRAGLLLLLGAVDLWPTALLLVRQRGLHCDVAVYYPDVGWRSGAAGEKEDKFLVSPRAMFLKVSRPRVSEVSHYGHICFEQKVIFFCYESPENTHI